MISHVLEEEGNNRSEGKMIAIGKVLVTSLNAQKVSQHRSPSVSALLDFAF